MLANLYNMIRKKIFFILLGGKGLTKVKYKTKQMTELIDFLQSEEGHNHIYAGNDSFEALSEEMDNLPTHYPAVMTSNEIKAVFL